jgi:cyanophycinase
VFARFGATGCAMVNPRTRSEADDASLVQALDEATGVFMSGGNQLKLSQIFAGTACGEAILRAHRRGAVVGGTSAGASIMSEFMISLGDESRHAAAAHQPAHATGSACSTASSSTSTSPNVSGTAA